jgi:hypothetical protein
LDYFINRNVPDEMFEGVLKARLNDPDPAKEQSKVICAEILEAVDVLEKVAGEKGGQETRRRFVSIYGK